MTKKANQYPYKGKSLEEIVEMSVTKHGYEIFTDEESICDMQDAIAKLSNDEYEEYVSKCLYNTADRQAVIMEIIAHAYAPLEAAKIYSRIANKSFVEERDHLAKANRDMEKNLETAVTNAQTLNQWLAEEKIKSAGLEEQLAAKDQEILRLKAKLFDLMDK